MSKYCVGGQLKIKHDLNRNLIFCLKQEKNTQTLRKLLLNIISQKKGSTHHWLNTIDQLFCAQLKIKINCAYLIYSRKNNNHAYRMNLMRKKNISERYILKVKNKHPNEINQLG